MQNKRHFVAELHDLSRANVVRIELCRFMNSDVTRRCNVIDEKNLRELAAFKDKLARTSVGVPPGKVEVMSEAMLKITLVEANNRSLSRCLRVITFYGFPESYLNDIESDSACSLVRKYGSAYATIEKLE